MRKIVCSLVILINSVYLFAQWKPVGGRIMTEWAAKIDVENVLPEYPRPIMERADWINLNGLWNYAISPVGQAMPQSYDGRILVPFAVESSLSGVGKSLGEKNELWYQRQFSVPSKWKGHRILLHFGAVDWKADVWVNKVKVGQHTGGFTPFSFDITPALLNGENELIVKVWDPTDKGPQPRGKQVSKPGGIWYTPVSGIWQTVWLEPVPIRSIVNIKTTPDVADGCAQSYVPANLQSFELVTVTATSPPKPFIFISFVDNESESFISFTGSSLSEQPHRKRVADNTIDILFNRFILCILFKR